MNEIHISGVAKHSWRYDGNLFVRVSVPRDNQRPSRSPEQGGSYDYLTVLLPGAADRGTRIERDQRLIVHGWVQSRDIHESLADLHRRAKGGETPESSELDGLTVHRTMQEVVAERWVVL
jgi:hypothetical protein